MLGDVTKKFAKRLKKMTQKERDQLMMDTFKKIDDMYRQEIKMSIKHLEENGYKVIKKWMT